MAKPTKLLPKADKDVDDYYFYIRQDNPQAALRFLDSVDVSFLRISNFPKMGSTRFFHLKSLENMRVVPVSNFHKYLIFYVEHSNYVDIIRILHSSMDISEELLWE